MIGQVVPEENIFDNGGQIMTKDGRRIMGILFATAQVINRRWMHISDERKIELSHIKDAGST